MDAEKRIVALKLKTTSKGTPAVDATDATADAVEHVDASSASDAAWTAWSAWYKKKYKMQHKYQLIIMEVHGFAHMVHIMKYSSLRLWASVSGRQKSLSEEKKGKKNLFLFAYLVQVQEHLALLNEFYKFSYFLSIYFSWIKRNQELKLKLKEKDIETLIFTLFLSVFMASSRQTSYN